jgi:hypothetical protein
MVVKTQRMGDASACHILYNAYIWAQYSDHEEYRGVVPLLVPIDSESVASHELHEHICSQILQDQIFPK